MTPLTIAAILLIGGGALLAPDVPGQEAKRYRIGVLNTALAGNAPMVEGLKAGLKPLGMAEGTDVSFDIRFTRGNVKALSDAAVALVNAKVDLIFANGDVAAKTAKGATQTIPIVFTVVSDPVAAGLVAELARPGGNVTGISGLTTDLVPKRLEILKSLVPDVRRVMVVAHPDDAASLAAVKKAQAVAPQLKLEVLARTVRTRADVQRAVKELGPGDGLLPPDLSSLDIPGQLLELSLAAKIPAIFPTTLWIHQGALASYGSDHYFEGIQAAALVARILKGAKPQDVPVEGAKKLTFAINRETAKNLGLTVPPELLKTADKVVE